MSDGSSGLSQRRTDPATAWATENQRHGGPSPPLTLWPASAPHHWLKPTRSQEAGASLLQSTGVSTGATKQGGRESKQELRRELRKRQKHGYEGLNGINYFKAHFYLKKF